VRFLTPALHRGAHEFYRLRQSFEYRLGDEEVPDIELDHLWQRSDCLGRTIIKAMARMHFQSQTRGALHARVYELPFSLGLASPTFGQRVAPRTRMDLYDRRTELRSHLNLRWGRDDE